MGDFEFLTIAEASRRIQKRELSPVELTDALLARIEALNPQLDAVVTPTPELARRQAREAEAEIAAGRYRGPLHGIPFGLKDIYDTRGILTAGGSRTEINRVPDADATTVTLLYEAGAVLLGKLTTHEFAHGGPSFDLPWPPARNPWNVEHFTGGSSSGSGAAVAAGLVLGAMGTDTGGSIRGPAAFCGITGFKPTYGLVSRAGVIPNSYSYDHCGPMTWTVEDAAIMLQAIVGYDPKDAGSVRYDAPDYRAALNGDVRGLRVGVVRHFYEEDVPASEEQRRAIDEAVSVFEKLGAAVEDVRLAPLREYSDTKIAIAESELFSAHRKSLCSPRPGDLGRDFLTRALPACLFTALDYVAAQRSRRRLNAAMEPIYERYDVLLTAGAFGAAPRLDAHRPTAFWERPNITSPFNVTGGPAIVVCAGFNQAGLPLSLQIAGRPFDDTTVLRAAHAYEQATPWRGRRPQLQPGAQRVEVHQNLPEPKVELDAATRDLVAYRARAAGLQLNDFQMALLCEAAPFALAMSERLQARDYAWNEEPAHIFAAPRS